MLNNEIPLALLVVILAVLFLLVVRQAELAKAIRVILARTSSLASETEQEFQVEIMALVGQGRTTDAIRAYRQKFGASLAEAALAVESMSQRNTET